jgi:hypothetical protein
MNVKDKQCILFLSRVQKKHLPDIASPVHHHDHSPAFSQGSRRATFLKSVVDQFWSNVFSGCYLAILQ